jgi:endoglucanase Acf2
MLAGAGCTPGLSGPTPGEPVRENPEVKRLGKGGYRLVPSRGDREVPEAPYRTGVMWERAVPTNQWYSSVVFTQWSEVLHANPLTFKATPAGLEMGLPQKQIVPTPREDVEVFYPHGADLVFSPTAFAPESAKLANHGDWSIDVALEQGAEQMLSTIAHGSPYAYFRLSSGDLQVKPAPGLEAVPFKGDSRVLLVEGKGKTYAVFGPSGSLWSNAADSGSDSPKQPTFGQEQTLVVYDGRLHPELNWGTYNPEGKISVTDSDDDSVFFMDREDREDKFLKIRKNGTDGNIFTVYGEEQGPQRADLSYWAAQGELVLDLRVNSADPGVELLVKLDSGWPNVSDYSVPLPDPGTWTTVRVPVRDILANSNRFSPGAYADITKMVNLVVLEPTGNMSVDVDNIRFEINPDLAPVDRSGWVLSLPKERRYVSAAVLPNSRAVTVRYFLRSAYTFITDTKAEWEVDRSRSEVVTRFQAVTEQFEGFTAPPIIGLYPHHYHENSKLPKSKRGVLESIRGPIQLYASSDFTTRHRYPGFVPYWPGVVDEDSRDALATQLSRDAARARSLILEIGWGPYWQGKGLQRITQLMSVADAQGEESIRERLLDLTRERMAEWLSGESNKTYFHYSPGIGTLVSYPEEYDAVKNLNDHHFHYGYWIRAASDIALRDPEWGKPENWGAMIDLLVADIATAERGRKDFPYLRSFDPYEGHGWAGGTGMDPNGNNQESSSESLNAWAGLIQWGAVTGRPDLVDLGIYLYTTEIQSVNHYWFDIHGLSLPPEYVNEEVSIVFGGRLAHTTWWTDEPRQIHGINLLPLTSSSTYLATSPEFVRRNLEALDREMVIYRDRGKAANPKDIWQDLFAKYLALVDPQAGFERWDEYGSFELGDTRSHALHWLSFLREVGPPDLSVTADTPHYAVFRQADGTRTYLVFNPSATPTSVTFSDGTVVEALPGQLTQHRAQ